MASWYKKSSSEFILYHSSELPYPILDNKILICSDNLFTEHASNVENEAAISVNKKLIKRQSAHYWESLSFPLLIEKEKRIFVRNKCFKKFENESVKVGLFKSSFVKKRYYKSYDFVEQYDNSYLISKTASSDPDVITFSEMVDDFFCCSSWCCAVLNIINNLCKSSERKNNWTKNIADITLEVYGIKNEKELDKLKNSIELLGATEKIEVLIR